jgi:putative oxidoreductase
MLPILDRFSPHAYAVMRIVAGVLFMQHGLQKLFGLFGQPKVPLASFGGVAGVIELVCGALIVLGLLGSLAALIASAEMLAAYFIAHAGKSAWPIVNQGEMALLYCVIFLCVAANGSGIWSVDALRAKDTSDRPRFHLGRRHVA